MQKIWQEPETITPPPPLLAAVDGDEFIAQSLFKRGIRNSVEALAFLDPNHYSPSPAANLPGLSQAADRLEAAISDEEKILVWGDFDVDGQTATTLLVEALEDLGADVFYHIPNREEEGHGIKVEVLRKYVTTENQGRNSQHGILNSPSILLTCDTGITEYTVVDYANSLGVDVIITDHHEPQDTLPKALAIVNPHLLNDGENPLAGLPGVGVAYKLIEELYNRLSSPVILRKYLDLVALGIVADIAKLTGDTRFLLQLGLNQLRKTPRLGLQALYQVADITPESIDEVLIGFTIGPRLNALGRLSDANIIVEFFTTTDLSRARILAYQLEALNQRRRLITEQIYQGALTLLKHDPDLLDSSALVLAHENWPNGIIGLVASRLAERYQKPTILLNKHSDGSAHGSARSVEGIHITQAIKAQSDLLNNFGGHAGAAGLSLPVDNIPKFRVGFSRTIKRITSKLRQDPTLHIDAYFPFQQISMDLLEKFQRLSPFGLGNQPLILASRNLKLVSSRVFGRNQEHLRLVVEDQKGITNELIYWRGNGESLPPKGAEFDLAYQLGSRTYQGDRQLQLEWIDFRIHDWDLLVQETPSSLIKVIDYREEFNPRSILERLKKNNPVQVWAEGEPRSSVEGLNRLQLTATKYLAIWHTPPSYNVLSEIIDRAEPDTIYFFARSPGLDTQNQFLKRLSGLVKHSIRNNVEGIPLHELAAAMAHNPGTIQMGLVWLDAKGYIRFNISQDNVVFLSPGLGDQNPEINTITAELKVMLSETMAFRKYLETTKIGSIDFKAADL